MTHFESFSELLVEFDPEKKVLWQRMNPIARPSFSTTILKEMQASLDQVCRLSKGADANNIPVKYLVLASNIPNIFNLGGDLELFMKAITSKNKEILYNYAHDCIEIQYNLSSNLSLPLSTIALVQGDALGGGFEAVLAHDVIIAERHAKFGLPEVLFNLFPGMGALSFLSRRMSLMEAEKMVMSGRIYTADQMLELGIVDKVVDQGFGEQAVYDFIRSADRNWLSRNAVNKARAFINPVTYDELVNIVDLWTEYALALSPTDLRKMRHFIVAQNRRWSKR